MQLLNIMRLLLTHTVYMLIEPMPVSIHSNVKFIQSSHIILVHTVQGRIQKSRRGEAIQEVPQVKISTKTWINKSF